MDLTEQHTETLKVVDAEYSIESGHKIPQPVVHLFCRDADRNYRQVDVEGFRPYFMMDYDEFVERTSDVINDRHVLAVEADLSDFADDSGLSDDTTFDGPQDVAATLTENANETVVTHDPETFDALDGRQLVKVFTVEPEHVGKIRDHWERTWEADIPFVRRFLISSGIHHGIAVPDGASCVRYENWSDHSDSETRVQEIQPADPPTVEPRMLVTDIEVRTNGGGVPDPADANNEITAITAYDNYTDEYAGWILESEEWEREYDSDEFTDHVTDYHPDIDLDTMAVFDHETQMVEDFHSWVLDRNFDMVSGWNSNGFDMPYIIQRSYNISAFSIRDWDMGDSPFNAGDEWPEPVVEGIVLFDMLDAYKKTQFRDLRSYKLEDVAQAELDMGKVQLEESLDDAWHKQPVEFMRYNVRDVEAVVEIERESALLDLYDNMRQVTGAQYNTCNHNGPMLDTLFLRQAYDEGIALTTNYAPEQGDYPGAKVFEPIPGVHENVVYPDLASLYPYIMWTLNISPETLYMDQDEYRADGYTDDEMFTAYIDTREWKVVSSGESITPGNIDKDTYKGVHNEDGKRKKSGDFDGIFEPLVDEHPKSKTEIYFVKPDVQEGFIRKTVDLLVDLKYRYKGQGDMYSAVKRVTNSLYGTLGDSASGGKGFRLFDWRLAEAITNAGRLIIEYTADKYIEYIDHYAESAGYDPDTYLVAGDTDSVMSSIPQAPDYQTALQWAEMASEDVSEDEYDVFMEDTFNVIRGRDTHKMDVEIESLASNLFFTQDEDDPDSAVKKRYAQHMIWDEDDGWLDTADDEPDDPDDRSDLKHRDNVSLDDYEDGVLAEWGDPHDHIGIKGFEYVRSDSATVTKESQLNVLTYILLADTPEDRIYEYLSDLVDEIHSDDFAVEKIGRPKGISNPLDDYGWKSVEELANDANYTVRDDDEERGGRYVSTPSPAYRGAKYADDHIPWEDVGDGSKPIRFYVEKVRGNTFPAAYEYDSYPKDSARGDPPEVDRPVDAIAVEDPTRVPDEFVLDLDKMVEKELEDKIQPILLTIGEDWDGLVGEGRQVGLDNWT